MAKVTVDAGICGFSTSIFVSSEDKQTASVRIQTTCPNIKPLESAPFEIDGYAECFGKIGETPVFEHLRGVCRHSACPVPTAVIKGVEVACGLALAKDATIHIEKDL